MTLSDFEKQLKQLYMPPTKQFSFVDVPNAQFAMIDGHGNPGGEEYLHAIEWLFKVILPIKKIAKQRMGKNFKEPPLECLYWGEDHANWQLMIVLPDWVDDEMFNNCIFEPAKRLGTPPKTLRKEHFEEAKCVQIMHIGAPKTQAASLIQLHQEFLPSHDLTAHGRHHEIYLNDANRVDAEKLKTILRQPVMS